jgi:predicted pyridoxine 5'-phosphate oxidase superfamily flavin-nucleotide-binding protein
MITDPVREFLQKPLIARMSTIDPNGYPHTVPVWFVLDGDDIVVISVRNTRKVGHILANPKGAVVIGGDSADGAGYLIKGEFAIEADPEDVWVKKMTYRYEASEQAEKDIADWAELDIIVLRLKPKVVLKVM